MSLGQRRSVRGRGHCRRRRRRWEAQRAPPPAPRPVHVPTSLGYRVGSAVGKGRQDRTLDCGPHQPRPVTPHTKPPEARLARGSLRNTRSALGRPCSVIPAAAAQPHDRWDFPGRA